MPSHVQSYYLASANPSPERPRLDSDASCDVCVVGGGITGTSTALHLAEMGYDVVLLEAERIALGASGRSGGQAIVGYARDMGVITALVSKDDARRLWDMSVEAIELVKDLVERHHIPCDLKWGYLHVALKRRQVDELRAMKDEFEGVCEYRGTTLLGRDEIRARVGSERYIGGLYDPRSGHLHPMNYTLGLAAAAEAAGTRIFENSRAIDLDTGDSPAVHTAAGRVRCKYLVLGTNAYLEKLIPQVRSRIMPVGTYIVATEPLGEERARQLIRGDEAVADLNFIVNYYRLSGDKRLLFGGRVSYSGREPADLPATMHRAMLKVFPQLADARSEYVWGGDVAITMNRMPHFGRIGRNVYFAHGFSGHGIALTGLAGKLMAEAIAGRAKRFDVFSRIPHAGFPGGELLRTPSLVLAMAYFWLRDHL